MLDRAHRLTASRDFAEAARRGRRVGSSTLVLHLLRTRDGRSAGTPRVGFVVGKRIGNAVTRNQVKRRLRHIARSRLAALPPDSLLVVRALPPAARGTSESLAADFDRALATALSSGGRR